VLLLSSKWYFWWGGWSFGYRLIVDIACTATLFVAPVLQEVFRKRWLLGVFLATILWSVGVQVLGAFAYDLQGWNAPVAGWVVEAPGAAGTEVVTDRATLDRQIRERGVRVVQIVRRDVSDPRYRFRLWSLRDNAIAYYLTHFAEARRAKHEMMAKWIADPAR
jgi:hypothetical protein